MILSSRERRGLLTKAQLNVLKLREEGKNQTEIANILETTRQNISTIERRARRNLQLAEDTLRAYKELTMAQSLTIEPGVHLIDLPRQVVEAADHASIKLRADFTRIYNLIKYNVPECVSGARIEKPIRIMIFKDGDIEVYKA